MFYFICDLLFQSITTLSRPRTVSGAVPQKGLTTPLTRRVASGCYLCAGAIYVVFAWFSYWLDNLGFIFSKRGVRPSLCI